MTTNQKTSERNAGRRSAVADGSLRRAGLIGGMGKLFILTFSFCLLFSGCVSARKKGRTIHERFDYQIVQPAGGEAVALLTCHEIWLDEWKGGGRAFLADPKASELMSIHTNQTALGGSSILSIGSFQSEVSTNGIIAAGVASSQIIQGAGAAVGQIVNKSATGMPLK
jgi:hypothetical protein